MKKHNNMRVNREKPVQPGLKLLGGAAIGLLIAIILITVAFRVAFELGGTWKHAIAALVLMCIVTVSYAIVRSGKDNFEK